MERRNVLVSEAKPPMTSLKELIEKLDGGMDSNTNQLINGYIKKLEQHMKKIPENVSKERFEYERGYGYQQAIDDVLRFLRGENK